MGQPWSECHEKDKSRKSCPRRLRLHMRDHALVRLERTKGRFAVYRAGAGTDGLIPTPRALPGGARRSAAGAVAIGAGVVAAGATAAYYGGGGPYAYYGGEGGGGPRLLRRPGRMEPGLRGAQRHHLPARHNECPPRQQPPDAPLPVRERVAQFSPPSLLATNAKRLRKGAKRRSNPCFHLPALWIASLRSQ